MSEHVKVSRKQRRRDWLDRHLTFSQLQQQKTQLAEQAQQTKAAAAQNDKYRAALQTALGEAAEQTKELKYQRKHYEFEYDRALKHQWQAFQREQQVPCAHGSNPWATACKLTGCTVVSHMHRQTRRRTKRHGLQRVSTRRLLPRDLRR